MTTSVSLTIKPWGNSLGCRIPRALREDLNLSVDSVLDLQKVGGHWQIRVRPSLPKYRLSELVLEIRSENLHKEMQDDQPVGKEVW